MKFFQNILLVLLGGLVACSKMDDTYREFIRDGEVLYVSSADSVKVYPGKNRIKLSWLVSDEMVSKAKVYWNNRSDSVVVPIEVEQPVDTVNVMLEDMKEGSYSFDIYSYDDEGHSSVRVSTVGVVYGERYVSSLLQRPVTSALFTGGKVDIIWGSADEAVVATELTYLDASGNFQTVRVPVDSTETRLDHYDYDMDTQLQYRTLYLPDSMAVDTFYVAYDPVPVLGEPIAYDREGWEASASAYDEPSGRGPWNVLDGDPNTVWHMTKEAGETYPHSVTLDMGQENLVYGITFKQRVPLDGAVQLIEIQAGPDHENQEALGSFTLQNAEETQYVELLEPVSFRVFTVIVKSDYKNGDFTALAEIGAYKR